MALPQRYPKSAKVARGVFPGRIDPDKATFTDAYLRSLGKTPHRYERYDAGTKHQRYPGFGVRVTPRGKKSFFVLYRRNGKLKRATLGEYPGTSLKDAREAVVPRQDERGYAPAPRATPRDVVDVAFVHPPRPVGDAASRGVAVERTGGIGNVLLVDHTGPRPPRADATSLERARDLGW